MSTMSSRDQPPQHRVHAAQRVVEIDHPRLQHLPAAEGEQLLRQRRPRARAAFVDLVERIVARSTAAADRRQAADRRSR